MWETNSGTNCNQPPPPPHHHHHHFFFFFFPFTCVQAAASVHHAWWCDLIAPGVVHLDVPHPGIVKFGDIDSRRKVSHFPGLEHTDAPIQTREMSNLNLHAERKLNIHRVLGIYMPHTQGMWTLGFLDRVECNIPRDWGIYIYIYTQGVTLRLKP